MVSPPHQSQPGLIREPGAELPRTFFLGRYRVVDEIGIGGMASVHLARVDGPGGFQKWVAIKRIHPHLVEDDQFVDMFLDEARIAAGINHANVAQVFDLGKDESTYWIAMEYLHGEPLREVMRRVEERSDRVPFHIAARICADAAEGLHGAHELRGRNGQLLNLVHRDVTPHNLFITYEGYTKVVDFGIAKVIDRLASTRAGTLKGKLAYMSPEQVRGQEVDRRTDIFALGVVLWELTTNRRLFRMETDLDTLEKVQACVVPLPTTLMPNYPPELEQVVMRALAQRREDRYQTARELSRSLQRFLMTQGTFVGPEDVGDYVQGLFTDRVRKRERYLEWAAEVTSAVDVDELRKQQASGEQQNPSLLHGKNGGGSAPSQSHVTGREPVVGPHRSYGQDSAAASVVASVPHQNELASSSLMDEDEDIPTVVAQPREPDPPARGIRPAAGAPAPVWDGMRTQLMDP
ncbi:MAG TPA: serine/threonine-protein kinase, partial [Polyangiaceae bacterium]|nr:serine/threonine-protein kinase [Polyangiaceae bacterium]